MKKTLLVLSLLISMGLVFAQTTINFDDSAKWTAGSASITSYATDHTYVDGVFSATGGPALRNTTSTQDGYAGALGTYAWRLTNAAADWRITIAAGGVSTFSVDIRRWDASPSPAYNLEYSTDTGTNWTLISAVNNTTLDNVSAWKTFNGTINSANTNILIRLVTPGSTERIMVDNFIWTGYSGGSNIPPAISNIVETPSADIVNTTTVSVSATITDSDGTITSAQLRWGTATGTYGNTISMTASGSTYTTNTNIPAQTTGTTVYYVIDATDDDSDTTTSTEQSYPVVAPAITTIPYTQSFSGSFGDTYTFTVSGTKPWYIYNSDNASCNGFGSTLEEQWLILPGINFNNYAQERMTFNTIATYGVIDAVNYLKLLYSSDYFGLGDPSTATWNELSFANGGIGGGETPSGVINLSSISGTNVYLAFKYYSTNNATRWEVDDLNIYLSTAVITVNPSSLSGFTYEYLLGPSTEQQFSVSGSDLENDITITAPTDYEISETTGSGFTNQIVLEQVSGSVASTPIYVRLKAGLAIGTYNSEMISLTSTGATSQSVTCSGEVTTPPAPDEPTTDTATGVSESGFTATWNAVSGATGYYLDVYSMEGGGFATDLIISEYIEGSSSNKYIEIFNGTGTSVDLANYYLQLYSNGAPTPGSNVQLSGSLAHGATVVYKNGSAALTLPDGVTATTNGAVNFSGDDAVALYYNDGTKAAYFVDIFGVIDQDPGTAWTASGGLTTVDKTLVRKPSVSSGVTTNPTNNGDNVTTDFVTLGTEWDMYDQNTVTYLGSHNFTGGSTLTYVDGFENLNVGNVTSYNVSGLEPETTYFWVVRAYNNYGTSGNSTEGSVTTDEEPTPVELSSFTATINAQNYVTLTWVSQTETGLAGYYVYRSRTNQLGAAQLVSPIIPATNTAQVQSYVFTDTELFETGTYYYWLNSSDIDGSDQFHGPVSVFYNAEGDNPTPEIPLVTELKAVYPNPFNPMAFIPYSIAATTDVNFKIYNSRGQIVRDLNLGERVPGNYRITWDGTDYNGQPLANGVYYIKMTAGKDSFQRKAVLLK